VRGGVGGLVGGGGGGRVEGLTNTLSSLDGAGSGTGKYWLLGFRTTYPSLVKTSEVD
jgi:hypothetical protein